MCGLNGTEPRLHIRLSNGYEFVVPLPVGEKWTEELTRAYQGMPFITEASIKTCYGIPFLNLRQGLPYKMSPRKDDS